MTRMGDLRGIIELDILFKFKFPFTILFIVILLLGNKTCRCAPVINSTSELLLDNTDAKYLIKRYETHTENIDLTLTNSSDEFVLNSKHDEVAGSVSVPDFEPGINFTENELKEVKDIQKSSEDAITDNPHTSSESSMSKGTSSTNNYEETEHSAPTIGQSMGENTVLPSDVIGNRDVELEFRVRENNSIDNSNSNQTSTMENGAQIFSDTTSEETTRNYPITFSETTSEETTRNYPITFSETTSEETTRNYPVTFSETTSEETTRNYPITFSETPFEETTRNYPRPFSNPPSSETPQSTTYHENTENSTPSLQYIIQEIAIPNDILDNKPDAVEYTTNEDVSTSIDISTSKQGSMIESDATSKQNSSDSFHETHVPSTFKSLQSIHSSQPEPVGNTEYDEDEYVDPLHQALISYGLPDSFSEDEGIEYQSLVVSDEPPKNFSSGGTSISSRESVSRGSSENVSRDVTPSTESVGNLKATVGVDMAVKIQPDTKDKVDVKVNTHKKAPRHDADPNPVQNDEQRQEQKTATARDVIELPNGVVIDALFDSIDSLQDQLDICEEGIRQRLVVHKDVFFGNSQSLTETDEEVELPADEPAEEDLASPIVPEVAKYQQGWQVQENKRTTLGANYIKYTTTKHAWDDEEDTNDEEKHHPTSDDKSDDNYYHTLDTKTTMGNENNDDDDENDNRHLMTNSMSLQVHAALNGDQGKADNEKGNKLKRETRGKMEDSDHVTNDDQSYYASVARSVIQRLSERLRYLEVSIKDCNHLTQSMTRHKTPP